MNGTRTTGTVLFLLLGLGALACSPDLPRVTIHLRRPVDMALVCLEKGELAPAEACWEDSTSTRKAGTELVGFIANSDTGSVARLNLTTGEFVDLDAFIPGFTPQPVGFYPVAAIAGSNGKAIYTASTAGRSVGRVWIPYLERPELLQQPLDALMEGQRPPDGLILAVAEQDLPSPPTDVMQAGDTLLVALPDSAAVAKIPLAEFGSLSEIQPIAIPGGTPFTLDVSSDGGTLYVGHADAPFVSIVDLATGAESHRIDIAAPRRQSAYTPEEVALPAGTALPACMNGVDDDDDGQIDFAGGDPECTSPVAALETPTSQPVLGRVALAGDDAFLYVVNARDRIIAVIDTQTATRLDINAPDAPGANKLLRELGRADIEFPGNPTSIVAGRVDAERTGGPAGQKQRLVYVASTSSQLYAFEVDGLHAEGEEEAVLQPVHRFRDGNDAEQSVVSAPLLSDQGQSVPVGGTRRADYPSFGEYAITTEGSGDTAVTTHYGVRLLDDSRLQLGETWSLTHEGPILHRDARIGAFDHGTGQFVTPEPVFCTSGAEPGDTLVVRVPEEMSCGPFQGRAFAWEIAEVAEQRLTLVAGSGWIFTGPKDDTAASSKRQGTDLTRVPIPDPDSACFDGALGYQVRVPHGTWAVVGSKSGYLHRWEAGADGACAERADFDTAFVGRATERTLRDDKKASWSECPLPESKVSEYFDEQPFQNHAFALSILPGCVIEGEGENAAPQVLQTAPDVKWSFYVNAAIAPRTIGAWSGGTPRHVNIGLPSSLRWRGDSLFVVDSGQQQVIEIVPGADTVRQSYQ